MAVPLFDPAHAAASRCAPQLRAARAAGAGRRALHPRARGRGLRAGVRRVRRRAPRDRRRQRHRGADDRPARARRRAGRRGRRAVVHVLRQRRGDPADRRHGRSSATSTPRRSASPPETVRAALTPRTKAVIAVHLFGNVAPVARDRGARRAGRRGRRAGGRLDGPGRARPARSGTHRDVLVLPVQEPRRASATAAPITTRDDDARRPRAHAALPRLARQGHLRGGGLQLAPRRAAGGDPARAAPAPRRLGRAPRAGGRLVRRGRARRARRAARADAGRRRRRGTSTSSAHPSAPTSSWRGAAGRGHRRARLLPRAGPPPARDGAPTCRPASPLPGTDEAARDAPRAPDQRRRSRASRSTRSSPRVAPMRVWVDLTNSPHVLVLRPVDRARCARAGARGRGHGARLRADGRAVRAPRHRARGHRPPPRRAPGAPRRSGCVVALAALRALGARAALRPRARPRLQRRHASPRGCCGSRASTMFDYEWATVQHTINCRLAQAVVVPDAIPPERLARYGAARQAARATRGSRRSTTSPTSSPTRRCSTSSGSIARAPIAVVRTPPAVSLYHRFENPLFAQVLDRLREQGQAVVLPRTPEQRAELRRAAASSSPSARSTRRRSIAYADLVVSAGGTMNREAVALGTPGVDDVRGPPRARSTSADRRGPAAAPGARRGPRARAPRRDRRPARGPRACAATPRCSSTLARRRPCGHR